MDCIIWIQRSIQSKGPQTESQSYKLIDLNRKRSQLDNNQMQANTFIKDFFMNNGLTEEMQSLRFNCNTQKFSLLHSS